MQSEVTGKVVVITGAGRGIGKAFALAFGRAGAKVVVNDMGRAEEDGSSLAEAVAREIRDAGGQAVGVAESVAQWSTAHKIVQAAIDAFGRIDCVINNAGIVRDRFVFNMSESEWLDVVAVHLNGSFFMARAAATHFKEQQHGGFIHMTSASGLYGNRGQANYSAAKMGLLGLSKTIALDMARYNVRSNCIAPWAWTPMTATVPTDTEEGLRRVARMKKMEAGQIAPLALFLASDAAADVNGQVFGVRANEVYLFSQPELVRSIQSDHGWEPTSLGERIVATWKPAFSPNLGGAAAATWDPV